MEREWSEIPVEVVSKIFSYLSMKELYFLSKEVYLNAELHDIPSPLLVANKYMYTPAIIEHANIVTSLTLFKNPTPIVFEMIRLFSNLKTITFCGHCTLYDHLELWNWNNANHSVEKINIFGVNEKDSILLSKQPTFTKAFGTITKWFPNVKKIDVIEAELKDCFLMKYKVENPRLAERATVKSFSGEILTHATAEEIAASVGIFEEPFYYKGMFLYSKNSSYEGCACMFGMLE
jgi:hypothetical protein